MTMLYALDLQASSCHVRKRVVPIVVGQHSPQRSTQFNARTQISAEGEADPSLVTSDIGRRATDGHRR